MSERFECEHNWIIDNNKRKTNESLIVYDEEWNTLDDLCELLNQQDQRITELEEQLKNAIVPKFKLYDTVYTINIDRADGIESGKITQINFDGIKIIYQFTLYQTNYCHTYNYKDEKDVFATKEEAQAKLEELRRENKC